jgi:two-component system, response regulator PdtaR
MAGEKYVVATTENSVQIAVRNILNPQGYLFLGHCSDSVSLLRLIRNYHPEFIIIDVNLQMRELKGTLNTIDEEMLCSCIIIANYRDVELMNFLEKYKIISFCPKPLDRDLLLHTIEMANLNYKRVYELSQKLKEMTENYETRKVIDKAKWILVKKNGLSESEAYERIRKKSMDNRMTMKSLAEAIIFTSDITDNG